MISYLFIFAHLLQDSVLVSGMEDAMGIKSVFGRVIGSSRRKRNFHADALSGEEVNESDGKYSMQYHYRSDREFERSLVELESVYDQSISFSYSYESSVRPTIDDTELPLSPSSMDPAVETNALRSSQPSKRPTNSNFAVPSHERESQTFSNSSDQNLELNSTLSAATDPIVDSKTSTISSRNEINKGTTKFFTCESNGQINAKEVYTKNGLPSFDGIFNINYSYSVVSATDRSDFVTYLESYIIDTMASSILNCNGIEDRRLNAHDQQQRQRGLMAINSLNYTSSAPLLNALGQCGTRNVDRSYCFGIDSTAAILYSDENFETDIVGIAIDALKEVQKAMNNDIYTNKIPSLEKVALLRSSPEIPPPLGALLLNDDESNPVQISPKSSSEPEPEKPNEKVNEPISAQTKTALALMVVGLALLGWVAGRRRLTSQQIQDHAELVDEGDDESGLYPNHEGVTPPKEYKRRSSHMHPIHITNDIGNIDVDYDSNMADKEILQASALAISGTSSTESYTISLNTSDSSFA